MQSVLQSSQLLQRLACNQQILMLSQVSLACGGVSFVAAVLGENIGNLVEFFRGVAALVDNQAVVAVPLQTVQGVVTLIEALKHMGRVDDCIQIREGIQAGQVNLGSERDGLFCLLLLAGGGGVLKLLFNELLEHV